jgi:hypothetical protein
MYLGELKVLRVSGEGLSEARRQLPDDFPRRSARRMTHLGTLMARVLADRRLAPGSSFVYGTTFGETRSLEDYVDTFPNPSPLLFQGSIHPSGIQQVFVHRKIPIGTFIPVTGSNHLVASLLEIAFLAGETEVTVCGGEERGTWLLEQNKASPDAFGWAFALTRSPTSAIGTLSIEPDGDPTIPEPVDHAGFFGALETRSPLEIPRPRGGIYRIVWR